MSNSSTKSATTASIASALFGVSMFLCVASVNVPYQASGKTVLHWWQDDANLTATIASLFFTTIAAVLFVVVMNYVRTLASKAPGGDSSWTAFAHSMAGAFCSTMLVVAATRGVIGRLVKIDGDPLPGLDVLRFSTGLNYALLGTGAMGSLGLSMLAISIVVLKTRFLAKWVGVLGCVCSVPTLGAAVAMRGSLATPAVIVWALAMAVALWRQPADV